MRDVPVKVSTGSRGWVLVEQELLWECSEDRAEELNCSRGKNQEVWDDPSKIQALKRSIWSPGRNVMMEKPPLGCPRAANPEVQRLGSGDPSRQGVFGTPPEQPGHCHGLTPLLAAVCATGFKLDKVH